MEKRKKILPFFGVETNKLIISNVPHQDEVDTKRAGLLTPLDRCAAKPSPLQKKAALQRDAVPARPPAAERARCPLGASECLAHRRDGALITHAGWITAAPTAVAGSAVSPELASVRAEAWASLCPSRGSGQRALGIGCGGGGVCVWRGKVGG